MEVRYGSWQMTILALSWTWAILITKPKIFSYRFFDIFSQPDLSRVGHFIETVGTYEDKIFEKRAQLNQVFLSYILDLYHALIQFLVLSNGVISTAHKQKILTSWSSINYINKWSACFLLFEAITSTFSTTEIEIFIM